MTAYNVLNRATLVQGSAEDITQVVANLDAIAAVLNGGIDNSNIAAAAGILASKLSGYPSNVLQLLAGDGSWRSMPRITTSAFSGGPPGAPSDADIWIATGVDGVGARWKFQYNAGSASAYKWEFIGGAPVAFTTNPNILVNAGTLVSGTWFTPSALTYTTVRAGDYEMAGVVGFAANGSGDAYLQVQNYYGTTLSGLVADNPPTFALDTTHHVPGIPAVIAGIPASTAMGYAAATGNSAVIKFGTGSLIVRPKRIS